MVTIRRQWQLRLEGGCGPVVTNTGKVFNFPSLFWQAPCRPIEPPNLGGISLDYMFAVADLDIGLFWVAYYRFAVFINFRLETRLRVGIAHTN